MTVESYEMAPATSNSKDNTTFELPRPDGLPQNKKRRHRKQEDAIHLISWQWPLFMLLMGCLLYFIVDHIYGQLPYVPTEEEAIKNPSLFCGQRAQRFLRKLTSIGPRVFGSKENEEVAPLLITTELEAIRKEANPAQHFEYEIQKGDGVYPLATKVPFTNLFQDVQNVIAILHGSNGTHGIVINCHYDTVPTSDGASDDGISCAVMMELAKVLAASNKRLTHNIVFLFNGCEEVSLEASYLFLQHKWAKGVNVIINLEAAGLGGKSILFQAGPKNSWLMDYYIKHVPHPHGQVTGEEMFQNGIIPSDTDFRNFRDFGHMRGYDFAFNRNGYVYHTSFDSEKYIPLGSYQHLGDNILALLRSVGNAKEVAEVDKHQGGQTVFYDFLGWFMISYSKGAGIAFNILTLILGIITVIIFIGRLSRWAWLPQGPGPFGKLDEGEIFGRKLSMPTFMKRFQNNKTQSAGNESMYVHVADQKRGGNVSFPENGKAPYLPDSFTRSTDPVIAADDASIITMSQETNKYCTSQALVEYSFAVAAHLCGFLLGLLANVIFGVFIDGVASLAMPWYSNIWLIFPFYWCPYLAVHGSTILLINWWRADKRKLTVALTAQLNIAAHLSIWLVLLFVCICIGMRSTCIVLPLIFYTSVAMLIMHLTPLYLSAHKWVWLYLFLQIPAVVLNMYVSIILYALFIPITARSGNMNGDLYIAIVSAAIVFFNTSFIMPLITLVKRAKITILILAGLALIMLPIALPTSIGHPYSGNANSPTPQRYWIVHSDREFYNESGLTRRKETGFFILNQDRNSPKTIPLRGRSLRDFSSDCTDELYCGLPYYRTRMVPLGPKSNWIPASPPVIPVPTYVKAENKTCWANRCALELSLYGPDRMSFTFSPREGAKLEGWSINSKILQSSTFKGRPAYYVLIIRGDIKNKPYYPLTLTFSVADGNKPLVDIGLSGNFAHHNEYRTDEYIQFLDAMPDYTNIAPWIGAHRAYTF